MLIKGIKSIKSIKTSWTVSNAAPAGLQHV